MRESHDTVGQSRPLIGLPACIHAGDGRSYHVVGHKYVVAVAEGAGGVPLVIPAIGAGGGAGASIGEGIGADSGHDVADLVARLDGLLVTGSPSNVWPDEYGGPASRPGTRHDRARDATALPLIRAALDSGLPLLALCRGIQELNVVLGGTLHQNIQDLPGRMDHRGGNDLPVEERYALAHTVRLVPGGVLAGLAGCEEIEVNSLHAQGIDRLAPGLAVEAEAPDGTIEAVRVIGSQPGGTPAFALGIQWHPEWRFQESGFARRLFAAFGDAARARAAERGDSRAANGSAAPRARIV